MEKLALRERQEKRDKAVQQLSKAMNESISLSGEALRQLMEVTNDPREQVKARAQHVIEEARLQYDVALQQLRRFDDDERNERLEEIARSSMRATWAAAIAAGASVLAALLSALAPLLK
jgi:flagellar biosynthesis chaperone FliJ